MIHISKNTKIFLPIILSIMIGIFSKAPAFSGESFKDVEPTRKWELSANVALTNDYVFRGISQTDEGPAIQGGFDVARGIFYAGVWASNVDFADSIEIDWYAGIKPKYRDMEFDLGVIYYTYPDAADAGAELDYVEIKLGMSRKVSDRIKVGLTTYYSPEYTGEVGKVWTIEGGIEAELPKIRDRITSTFSAVLGTSIGENQFSGFTGDDDSYLYWNAGVGFGFHDKFNLDLRYHDTNIGAGALSGTADARFVATLSASF